MIDVQYPRRINAAGSTVKEYHPLSMSLDLNIKPLSTATMQLPGDENIPARSYVELYTPFGSAGIFRARSPEDAYGDDTTTVELEHAITEVGDYLVKGEYNEMMSAKNAMQTVFDHYGGKRWQLGSVSALGSDKIAMSVRYDRVLDAMLAILEQKPDCYLKFNFNTSPWTVSVATKDTEVSAEGRLSRNIDSARVIYDDTELCTRVYYEHESKTDSTDGVDLDGIPTFAAGKNYSAGTVVLHNGKLYALTNGHKAGVKWADTVSVVQSDIPTSKWEHLDADTIDTYGKLERTVSTGASYTEEEALKVAQEFLRTHKEPRVSVRVLGEELSSTTGEKLDAFTIGKLLRLALVDYDVTVEKTITGISWNDVIGEPEAMEILLGDEEDTAIKFLHDIDTSGGSGGGGGGKKAQDDLWKEYFTEYERDDYHFSLVAKHVAETNEILQQAGLYIDADGVLIYADDNEKQLGGKIKVESDRISLVVEGKGADAHIKAAEIVASINSQTGQSTIRISADVIDIDGLVSKLAAKSVGVGSLEVEGRATFKNSVYAEAAISCEGKIRSNTGFDPGDGNTYVAKSKTVVTSVSCTFPGITRSTEVTVSGVKGRLITAYTSGSFSQNTDTIYYLGR